MTPRLLVARLECMVVAAERVTDATWLVRIDVSADAEIDGEAVGLEHPGEYGVQVTRSGQSLRAKILVGPSHTSWLARVAAIAEVRRAVASGDERPLLAVERPPAQRVLGTAAPSEGGPGPVDPPLPRAAQRFIGTPGPADDAREARRAELLRAERARHR